MTHPEGSHELTLTAVDPDVDWGDVIANCSACGRLGVFHDAYSAHIHHSVKRGGTPAPALASVCRGVSLRGMRT
jgi:hypothetical protein